MTSLKRTADEKFTDGLSMNQVVDKIRSNGSEFKLPIIGSCENMTPPILQIKDQINSISIAVLSMHTFDGQPISVFLFRFK